jgi:hypothetical protein
LEILSLSGKSFGGQFVAFNYACCITIGISQIKEVGWCPFLTLNPSVTVGLPCLALHMWINGLFAGPGRAEFFVSTALDAQ